MKKIVEYRKLLNVTKDATLSELKSIYRQSMKENHPDKFTDDEKKKEVEALSMLTIEAYHFLVSIAPETLAKDKEVFNNTVTTSNLADFYMDKGVLFIHFFDDSKYEFFGVPKNTYIKMVNAESPSRFARRHIYGTFLYRSASKLVAI
jgi:hypothetical protein